MSKSKMSQDELRAESLRLGALIRKGSEAGLRGIAEMSKHPLSLEQMKEQVKKHQQQAAQGWTRTPIPASTKKTEK